MEQFDKMRSSRPRHCCGLELFCVYYLTKVKIDRADPIERTRADRTGSEQLNRRVKIVTESMATINLLCEGTRNIMPRAFLFRSATLFRNVS